MGSTAAQVGQLLVSAVAGFFLFIIVLRFLMQAVRADFYNPISQFIFKATNPLLLPVRKLIPGFGGYDIAALVVIVAVEILTICLIMLMAGYPLSITPIVVWALLGSVGLFLKLYQWGIIIMIAASWLAPHSTNPALVLLRQIIEPIMKPVRKVLPDMGGIDLSPMVVILGILSLLIILNGMASSVGAPGFIIGL